jgi:hypothetical protein
MVKQSRAAASVCLPALQPAIDLASAKQTLGEGK